MLLRSLNLDVVSCSYCRALVSAPEMHERRPITIGDDQEEAATFTSAHLKDVTLGVIVVQTGRVRPLRLLALLLSSAGRLLAAVLSLP